MLLTSRAAQAVVAEVGIGREQARQLLLAGCAGPAVPAGRSTLYEDSAVRELVQRPWVDERALAEGCPHGLYVARLARGRPFDVGWDWACQAQALAVQPAVTPMRRALLGVQIQVGAGLPWVVTISGLVAFGAVAVGGHVAEDGRTVFHLERPGTWYELLDGHWFPTGRGRHWFLWEPHRLTQ